MAEVRVKERLRLDGDGNREKDIGSKKERKGNEKRGKKRD